MEWVTLILRTLFVYFFILTIMRIMGKREIGKLSIFDLVVSIMIAELAVMTLDSTEASLVVGLAPVLVLFLTQMGLSWLSLKSERLRHMIDGQPSILVEQGQIREKEMRKQRYNLDDLLTQLREHELHSLTQVEFAILEPSGKLTVLPKTEQKNVDPPSSPTSVSHANLPVILIKDGEIQAERLDEIGQTTLWLKQELKKRTGQSSIRDITFCSIDDDGTWYIDTQDE